MSKPILERAASAAVILAGAALALAAPAQASAAIWNFSFTLSDGETGSGALTTLNAPAGGPYLVTALTGSIAGAAMALLAPEGTFNDNLLYATAPAFDGAGLGFTAGGYQWALWSASGTTVDSWCNNAVNGFDHQCDFASDPNGAVTSFSIATTGVPEPASWALMLLGVGGLGGALRSRRGSGTAANLPPA